MRSTSFREQRLALESFADMRARIEFELAQLELQLQTDHRRFETKLKLSPRNADSNVCYIYTALFRMARLAL